MAYKQINNPFKKINNDKKKKEKPASKEPEKSEFDYFKMNPNAYISGVPGRIMNYFKGK